ncbi:MAG: glycosyltransferase [Bacteroidota bacterium]
MHKVLFISFYWVPSGKATLHWPLYIIRHLPSFGWQPSVLTVNEDTISSRDDSLAHNVPESVKVSRTDYFDPFVFYRKFTGKSADAPLVSSEMISKENKAFRHRLAVWIRMNLFVPDARAGWYPYGVKEGRRLLSEEKFDAIVTIGPPHSTHLIGRKLAKQFNVPFFPVLIDPWVDIVYYKDFRRSLPVVKLDRHLERLVMKDASHAVFVTESTRADFVQRYPWLDKKSSVLYWGYNEESFIGIESPAETTASSVEIFLHAGNIFDYQNPPLLWSAIKRQIDRGRKIRLKFTGSVSPGIKQAVTAAGLDPHTEYTGFLPYDQMVREICSASFLLVCATEKRHVPGKLFEYMRSGRPILAFGDDNEEVSGFLERTRAGMLFRYSEDPSEFFDRSGEFTCDTAEVKKYDRRHLAGRLAEILKNYEL